MEKVDVLDEDGNFTGIEAAKEEVHKKGWWHPTVHIWVYNTKGEILLQKRAASKKTFPNLWDTSAAGHVQAGERPKEAAVREVGEELGVEITEIQLKEFAHAKTSKPIPNGTENEFHYIYALELETIGDLQEEEVAEIKWVSLEELKTVLSSDLCVPHPEEYNQKILIGLPKCMADEEESS